MGMGMWPSAPHRGLNRPPPPAPLTQEGSRVCGSRTGDVDAESSGTPFPDSPLVWTLCFRFSLGEFCSCSWKL